MDEIAFTTPRLRFGALAWGPDDGPLAVCLHGYPDTAWSWRAIAPRLAAGGWRVVAPFMRGYAPTEIPADADYSIASLARDAVECARALGGDERAVLIGHDWGAAATYAAAGAFARVVAMSVAPAPVLLAALRSAPGLALRQARHSWYMGFQQLPHISERSLDRLIPRLWRDWSPGYGAGEDAQRALEALDGPGRRRAALSYYRALPRTLGSVARGAMPAVPLLYLHGREDGCMLAELVERAREHFPPHARVELVDDAGHFLQLEQPERVGGLIADFLGPAPGSGAACSRPPA